MSYDDYREKATRQTDQATAAILLWVLAIVGAATLLFLSIRPAFADNGTGTPAFCERHCGVVEPTCPDPAPCVPTVCPDVQCGDTTVTVLPTPCPAPDFPNYRPCKRKADGSLQCPRKRTPRRVLVPERQ